MPAERADTPLSGINITLLMDFEIPENSTQNDEEPVTFKPCLRKTD